MAVGEDPGRAADDDAPGDVVDTSEGASSSWKSSLISKPSPSSATPLPPSVLSVGALTTAGAVSTAAFWITS